MEVYFNTHSETTTYNWQYRVRVSGTGVRFDMSQGSYTIMLPIEDSDDIEDGLWHHVAVSWSSLNGYLTLYLDGHYNNEMVFADGQTLSSRYVYSQILYCYTNSSINAFHIRENHTSK